MTWTVVDSLGNSVNVADSADASAPGGGHFRISLTHVATGAAFLDLPVILVELSENFKPTFKKETVYGRMDPIPTYQNTTRGMKLVFAMRRDLYGGSTSAPSQILSDVIKMLYPLYSENKAGTGYMAGAPLIRLKVAQYTGMGTGVLGIIDSFDVSKHLDQNKAALVQNTINAPEGAYYPNEIVITMNVTVVHEGGKVGWVYDPAKNEIHFGQGSTFPHREPSIIAPKGGAPVASAAAMVNTRGLTTNEANYVENLVDQFASPAGETPLVQTNTPGSWQLPNE